ncbi:7-cyano-7-deazaguanine synthase [Vallitalea guaymasensis]|uniref:7-cyano-7-deazaguanine synthase n=1 Tax=Vallitalea guaymasensis TaxID=1185412 RepID=UPI000DE443CD|nr:7-cyano-7-deazaguanine synthase [Vallitalea guaymasensis]
MKKQYCNRCGLHSNIPGVTINSDSICELCTTYEKDQVYEKRFRKVLTHKMNKLFKEVKERNHMYDAVVLFSGGKDSTYLLKLAKEKYQLRVLAVSIMHPVVNNVSEKNMHDVTKKMGIDHIQFYIQENVYKKAIRKGLLENEKYELDEFFGCTICSFFHYWIPIKMAMKMNIPIILEGSDLGQSGRPLYTEGNQIKHNIKKGYKPYGKIHDLIADVLGEEYKGSIYDYDSVELMSDNYPTIISPFTFTDYDYNKTLNEIEEMGLNSNKFNKIYTNCSLLPFISYFTIKKYECVPYVKQYASEIRRQEPVLMQLKTENDTNNKVLDKDNIMKIMDEYIKVINYVVDNKLSEEDILDTRKKDLIELAPTYLKIFKDDVGECLIKDVSKIPYYANFFGIKIYN